MKYRVCPFCKSKAGFEIRTQIHGYYIDKVLFNGKVISTNKTVVNDVDKYASCLNCFKLMPIEKLKTENL